jgi:hypothetical protein
LCPRGGRRDCRFRHQRSAYSWRTCYAFLAGSCHSTKQSVTQACVLFRAVAACRHRPLWTGQGRPGAPVAAAPGELLTLANQGLVNRACEQGDARAGNLVAEVPAGDAHLGGAGRPQHGVIEIGPLLRLTNGSHQSSASIYVLTGWAVVVNWCWAQVAPLCWAAKLLSIEAKVVLRQ